MSIYLYHFIYKYISQVVEPVPDSNPRHNFCVLLNFFHRIPPDMSRYIMRYYSKNTTPINSRWVVHGEKSRAKYHSDGLNNVEDKISHLEIEVHRLQTLIGVVLGPRERSTFKSKSPGIVLKYWKSLYCISLVIFVLLMW